MSRKIWVFPYIFKDFFMEKDMFWKNVSLLLKNKKISQEKMCEDLGMSIYTLRSSISKQVLPRVDVAKTIADYLDTSVDFLLTGKESNEYKERLEKLHDDKANEIQKIDEGLTLFGKYFMQLWW